ncbi:MAG: hypothetical protein UX20_C0025G0009 [Candidatus Magasanikbacteria bacterium GW2011_GWC2_45_8]|uniref:Uncharacterized protein n=1 Tax=Candidatus Magasanikbacteria bacterium GW2011_GWC2_45_8 TaxID=1619050 RepID=A0A0G1MYJ2_9BACT|nr:MAG: hypothetical protein UX20_C0025G0009 [Candidatus Magasanikbacteria bacterium GW2011_GWC2_45_8]
MDSKAFSPLFGENLKLVSVCPLCNAEKDAIKTQVVDENNDAHLIHMQCGECGSAVVALVVHASNGLNSVRSAAPIEIDDTLEFFEALQDQEEFLKQLVK